MLPGPKSALVDDSKPTILFDLDGTLIHLHVAIDGVRTALREFFRERGDDRMMRPILAAIRGASRACTQTAEDAEQVRRQAMGILDDAEVFAAKTATIETTVTQTVVALAMQGHRIGLLTNNGSRCAAEALNRLSIGSAFELVVSRDDVQEPKPSAEGIGLAWQGLGRPVDLWMVGDSIADVACARAFSEDNPDVSVEIIGVTGGRNSAAELSNAGANRIIDSLREIMPVPAATPK